MNRYSLLLSTLALAASSAGVASAAPAKPVEGYHTPDGKLACVMFQNYNKSGNAVECGTSTATRGVLLTNSGSARAVAWHWPSSDLGSDFFTARWNHTLYLSGGTAKLTGTATTLHCTFTQPSSVLCLNHTGHGLVVTPTTTSTVTPVAS